MTILDRRDNPRGQSATNRKRLLDRVRRRIKERVIEHITNRPIRDADEDHVVPVGDAGIDEYTFTHDKETGISGKPYMGNRDLIVGHKVNKKLMEGIRGRASGSGPISEDEFSFILSKKELMDLLFEGLSLPNFIQKSSASFRKWAYRRGGYSKDGIPPRLNLKRTFMNAVGRRLSSRAAGNPNPRFLDDVDLRYDRLIKEEIYITKAVVVFVMDVSGSMVKQHKDLAKYFFVMLYLFLTKKYTEIEIRFVRYHTEAEECSEHEFFYKKETGGTLISVGYTKVLEILKEYDLDTHNLYVAHATDGENWEMDNPAALGCFNGILTYIQAFFYVQVHPDQLLSDPSLKHNYFWNEFPTNEPRLFRSLIANIDNVYQAFLTFFGDRR
jgi:uncharacterized sporulation protein YeaH/YhbH (DUF444 family)